MTKGEANINRSDTEEAKESGKKKGRQEMEGETVRERQREIRDGGKSREIVWETKRQDRRVREADGGERKRDRGNSSGSQERKEATLCVKSRGEEPSLVIPALINLITAPGNAAHTHCIALKTATLSLSQSLSDSQKIPANPPQRKTFLNQYPRIVISKDPD